MAADYIRTSEGSGNVKITGNEYGTISEDGSNALSINTDGAIKIDWDNCPITEDSIRSIAKEEAKDMVEEQKFMWQAQQASNESPIEIMRRKVMDWLRS